MKWLLASAAHHCETRADAGEKDDVCNDPLTLAAPAMDVNGVEPLRVGCCLASVSRVGAQAC